MGSIGGRSREEERQEGREKKEGGKRREGEGGMEGGKGRDGEGINSEGGRKED